jgi:hypothetical protein
MKRFFVLTAVVSAVGFIVAACSSTPAPTVAPTLESPTPAIVTETPNACATDNPAPPGAFRSDPVRKLTASAKPKFIEFYGSW